MTIVSIFYGILLCFSSDFVWGNEIIVQIEDGDNNTFILYYNLKTNYSYYLTFRLFEHEQIKYGLFPANSSENTFQISNQYDSPSTIVYLFIICFHFIHQLNDIDIQCKDIRHLLKTHLHKSLLPSYKPLFIPMMYALSILVLLPVIIQHRRHKQVQLVERHKQLRRLSLTIVQDNPEILSKLVPHGNLNLKTIAIEIESSTKAIRDDNVTFTIQKPPIFVDEYKEDNDESGVTADDCIAHLLNHAPWNTTSIEKDPTDKFQEQRIPMIRKFHDDKREDRQSCTINLFKSNPAFIESDV